MVGMPVILAMLQLCSNGLPTPWLKWLYWAHHVPCSVLWCVRTAIECLMAYGGAELQKRLNFGTWLLMLPNFNINVGSDLSLNTQYVQAAGAILTLRVYGSKSAYINSIEKSMFQMFLFTCVSCAPCPTCMYCCCANLLPSYKMCQNFLYLISAGSAW